MVKWTPTTKGKVIAYHTHPEIPRGPRWIAKQLNMPYTTCYDIIQHHKVHGHIYNLPRSGRPRILDDQGEERLVRAIQRDPKANFDVFGEITQISQSTARRVAAKHGLHSRICRQKPMISAVNREKRMAWAMENELQAWNRVMFTDESCFRVGETGRERVIRKAGTEYDPKHMSVKFRHGASLHVWGANLIGQKLPLVRFNLARARTVNKQRIAAEKIDSKVYAEQILWGPLQDYVNGARARDVDVLVVEDGAPVHFKGAARTIRDLVDIPGLSHPPSSPDLNPIEGCWRIVKQALRGMDRRPTNVEGLWAEIQKIWDGIPQSTIDGMIESMAERREAILNANGGQTRW